MRHFDGMLLWPEGRVTGEISLDGPCHMIDVAPGNVHMEYLRRVYELQLTSFFMAVVSTIASTKRTAHNSSKQCSNMKLIDNQSELEYPRSEYPMFSTEDAIINEHTAIEIWLKLGFIKCYIRRILHVPTITHSGRVNNTGLLHLHQQTSPKFESKYTIFCQQNALRDAYA